MVDKKIKLPKETCEKFYSSLYSAAKRIIQERKSETLGKNLAH